MPATLGPPEMCRGIKLRGDEGRGGTALKVYSLHTSPLIKAADAARSTRSCFSHLFDSPRAPTLILCVRPLCA